MNLSCNIIRDLLPLYCDDICSEDSREMIENHLSDCQECSDIFRKMQSDSNEIKKGQPFELEKSKVLKGIKKSIFKKKVLIAIIAVVSTITAVLGLYSAATLIESPKEYIDGLVRVEPAYDGAINLFYQGSNYACVYGMEKEITVDGQTKNAAFIYYTDSFWTKYLERKHSSGTLQFTMGEDIMADYGGTGEEVRGNGKIEAVYYLVGDYSKLITVNQEKFSKYEKEAVLLWER